jgi:tyrosine-protein phosphatase SIW14
LPRLPYRSAVFKIPELFLLMLAIGITPALPQSKNQDNPSPLHSMATRLKGTGIPRFARVSADLYRGGQPSAEGLQELERMDVRVIVDMRGSASDTERDAVTKLGMQYVSIPSHCPFPGDKPWARFLELMEQNRGKKVFVHCQLGDDRTGLAVASYRMAEEGWTPAEALKEMRAFGFAYWHRGICPGMESYVRSFPQRLEKDAAFQQLPSRRKHESVERSQ